MRNYFLLTLLVAGAATGNAQVDSASEEAPKDRRSFSSRLLVKVFGGYGFLSPGSYRIESRNSVTIRNSVNNPIDTIAQTQGRKGVGGGLRYGGGFGFIINDFWTAGVDIEYQKSQKLSNALGTKLDTYNYDSTSDEMHYEAMTITPYITFKAVSKPNYFLYNRVGVLFTLPFTLHKTGNSSTSRSDHWPPGPSDSSMFPSLNISYQDRKDDYKLALGIGFNLAFGISYRLSSHLRVFGEVFGNFSALHPESSKSADVTRGRYETVMPVYDYVGDPPVFTIIRYDPYTSASNYYLTVNTKYQNGGETESKQDSYNWAPGSPDYYETYSNRDQRFHINMNSIGLNCGIQLRLDN